MGIWEFISSAAEAVQRNVPDATPLKDAVTKIDEAVASPVKNACKSSYTRGCAAFNKIDQAVRIDDLDKLGQWMPDDETKSKIGMVTAKFAKNAGLYALQEGHKLIPGGVAVSEILSKTLNDVKYENLESEKLKLISGEKMGSPPTHLSCGRELIYQAEMNSNRGVVSVSDDGFHVASAADRSPEDVIRVFMMKEFVGTRFFDGLMVRESTRKKGESPE